MSNNTGKVSQIIGPVVDVVFDDNENGLPNIYDSLVITRENGSKLVLECQQHIGEDTVRAIAMETTDGISRGVSVLATGSPIQMPSGEDIKGRVFNVIGDSIDGMENLSKEMDYLFTGIHQDLKTYLQLQKCYLQVLKLLIL